LYVCRICFKYDIVLVQNSSLDRPQIHYVVLLILGVDNNDAPWSRISRTGLVGLELQIWQARPRYLRYDHCWYTLCGKDIYRYRWLPKDVPRKVIRSTLHTWCHIWRVIHSRAHHWGNMTHWNIYGTRRKSLSNVTQKFPIKA
jgi:hypothetical protein